METSTKLVLIMALCFGMMIQSLNADVAVYDNVWQKRAEDAKKNTMDAYIPNVMEVGNEKNVGTATVAVQSATGEVKVPGASAPASGGVTDPTANAPASGGVTVPIANAPTSGGVTVPTANAQVAATPEPAIKQR